MVASEEPAILRFLAESATGDVTILHQGIRTELLSTTTIASRVRLDVPNSPVAQGLNPTPQTGRPVQGIPKVAIQENGYLLVQAQADAADTLDSDDPLMKMNLGIIVEDLQAAAKSPARFRTRQLTKAARDTTRVADDPALVTTSFVDVMAFKVPTGQNWLFHGEHEIFLADDTA